MNMRHSTRYSFELLPDNFNTVTILWDDNAPIKSKVVNYSAHGIMVLISLLQIEFDIPKENDTIKVLMPIDQMWLTGKCVSSTNKQDGFFTMGIYFYNPTEQNYLQNMLIKSLNKNHQPLSSVSYEWEELVDKLCNSDDPFLMKIGFAERDIMPGREKYI